MAEIVQLDTETALLHATAAQCRLRVVESQLTLALTLCDIAETDLRYGRLDETVKLVSKLWHYAEIVRIHLDDPNHLPRVARSDIRSRLTQLQERIKKVESRLRRQ